jgi:L-amino acid N-acyltransferase YncA
MTGRFNIRAIETADAAGTLEVYRPYVEKTTISFEYNVPSLHEWQTRIETNTKEYPWLICEYDNRMIGYAYGSKHRYRTAYMWSPESTVYLNEKFHGLGIARLLYQSLFEMMKLQGFVNVYAGVAIPNNKSESFHKAMGFEEIGIFRNIGYKFGNWHDTRWFQKQLTGLPEDPSLPLSFSGLKKLPGYSAILLKANEGLSRIRKTT